MCDNTVFYRRTAFCLKESQCKYSKYFWTRPPLVKSGSVAHSMRAQTGNLEMQFVRHQQNQMQVSFYSKNKAVCVTSLWLCLWELVSWLMLPQCLCLCYYDIVLHRVVVGICRTSLNTSRNVANLAKLAVSTVELMQLINRALGSWRCALWAAPGPVPITSPNKNNLS